jgi:surface polysaccharide O-acyltransferase-like enzyme
MQTSGAQAAGGAAVATIARADRTPRLGFLDQTRAVLTLLVVLHHTAITYGGPGSWYYREPAAAGSLPVTLFTLFCAINQAFFMGAFFLIAGYVTPPSLARKGLRRFAVDRSIRLGVPLLVYMLVLDGLTVAIARTARGAHFTDALANEMLHGDFGPGPLWFVEALLIFTAVYAAWHWLVQRTAQVDAAPLPSHRVLLAAAVLTGACAFVVRLWMPVGREIAHLQLGYFASYVALFAAGCIAARHRWLERIDRDCMQPWLIVALCTLPVLPVAVLVHGAIAHAPANVAGGANPWALLYAYWEPFVAWGVLLALLWGFRTHVAPSRLQPLARRAYAIYCFHPPVVVAISVALRGWAAPALLKFATVGTLSCVALYLLAGALLRVPLLARVW